jgi:acetyl-CoA carboxylase beta subunit
MNTKYCEHCKTNICKNNFARHCKTKTHLEKQYVIKAIEEHEQKIDDEEFISMRSGSVDELRACFKNMNQ